MGTVFKGWNAKIYIGGIEVGCCESVSVDVASNIEPYYCIGSRNPFAVIPGNLEITGSISRAWVNCYYLNLLISDAVPIFDLVFKAGEGGAVKAPWVYLYNCRFESGAIDIPQDGVLTEDYDFRAESIACVMEP